MATSIRSGIGALLEVRADLDGPIGERVRNGLSRSSIVAQIVGHIMREV